MYIPVYISVPNPHLVKQQGFISRLKEEMNRLGIELVQADYVDVSASDSIKSITQMLSEVYGIVSVAFSRRYIFSGADLYHADITGRTETVIENTKETSAYVHIELAIALAIDKPALVIKEQGIAEDGMLEPGVVPFELPAFNLDGDQIEDYFNSDSWKRISKRFADTVSDYYIKNRIFFTGN